MHWFEQPIDSPCPVQFTLSHAATPEELLHRLSDESYDAALISLADHQGLEKLGLVHAQAPDLPVIALGTEDDETLALEAVRRGAQDYLVQTRLTGEWLARAIRYAIERQRWRAELRSMSLEDELTGLYNRRGFILLAGQQLKLAQRVKRKAALIFADLDGLKKINDQFGHSEGDAALRQIADIFKETFRGSDIIARIGGDEFAILAIESPTANSITMIARVQKKLETWNARSNRGYMMALSIGVAHYNPDHSVSIKDLLARADTLMYNQKRKKRKTRKR